MYPEFILIYAGMGLLFVLLIVVIVLLIAILRKGSSSTPQRQSMYPNAAKKSVPDSVNKQQGGGQAVSGKVVFCLNCAEKYDAAMLFCPKCGAPRQK